MAEPADHGDRDDSARDRDDTARDRARLSQLISDARAGDEAAFAKLYVGHVNPLRRYARRLAVHEHLAEDLVSEAFARTWAQLAAGRGPREAFAAYLRAAVLHLHLNALKKDRALRWVPDVEGAAMANPDLAARIAEDGPEDAVLERLFNDRIKQALATLPHRWQVVLVRIYVENHSYRDVAAHLELTVDATRHLAQRARQGMRRALSELAERDHAA
jgi:RNA polymerase sigma factor (sigma-70 family)